VIGKQEYGILARVKEMVDRQIVAVDQEKADQHERPGDNRVTFREAGHDAKLAVRTAAK
jgi:hypothetical protein